MRGPILLSWCGRLGVAAALLVAVGCGGGTSQMGSGGCRGPGRRRRRFGGQAGGSGGSGGGGANTFTATFSGNAPNVDILFMIDNSSSMTEMQNKLYTQLPTFVQTLQALPTPPSLHVAVVSSDMGAPGDSPRRPLHDGGRPGAVPVLAAGTCPARRSHRRHLHLRRGHDAELQRRQPVRRCSSASRSSATRVAASSTSSRRSTARSAPTAARRPPPTPTSCGPRPTSASSS